MKRGAARVVVVPLLVSSSAGSISQRTLPADLAGLPIAYSGAPLLPDENLVRWVERQVLEASRPR
ncbi:MAG: hypothetical protein ABJF01_05095 [bacterium]